MKYNDTVFEASSMEIFDLARNFNNDDFQHKLLDNLVIKKRTKKSKREENVHFKAHPNLLGTDSNVLEKTFLENDHEEFCDTDSEHNFDFFLSKHKDNLSQLSPFEKEGIESKVELQTIRCEINNSSTKLRLIEDLIIRSMQRTCTCLDEISLSLSSKVTMPDGEDDWRRRQVRTIEFSSRFKRNYLYELGRQIIELEKAVKGSRSPGGFKSVPRCVLSAHQTLLQAFQAYNNHIPTCLGNVATDKLQIAIDHANKLFKVHLELLGSTDPGTEMKKSLIESITGKFELVLLKATNVMVEPIVHAQSNIPSIKTYLSTTKLKKKIRKKMGSKFSMYIIPPTLKKGEVWKKSTNSLATDKHLHNIQSRYKTAGFKHRPQIEKSKTANVLLKNKLDSPKSAPCLTTMSKNEDNIETMVERIKHWEDDEGHCKAGGMTEAGAECLADTTLTGTIDNEVINKNLHLGDDGISKHLLLDLPELLKEIQNVNGKAHFENDDECVDNNESNKNWQTVYVTGQKNAQLICIRDNSSTPDLVLTQPNPSLATISRESTLEEIIPAYEDGKKLRTVKISRLSKPTLNVLKPLPIVQIKSILQGKLRQAKYIKGNPMYCKTYKTHPWHIIEEIAEHLLNDALLSLVKEIQVQSILESLYISEFQ